MNGPILRQGINIVAFIAALAVNGLANTHLIGGVTTAEIATRYPITFLPANFTFGIWGIIYLGLVAFVVQQARPSERNDAYVRQLDVLFPVTCLANLFWLVAFQNRLFALSMVPMLVLLGSLIAIYVHLGIGRQAVSTTKLWTVQVPFSLYLGWITVATIANATYVLYDAGWKANGDIWTAGLMVVAAAITGFFIVARRDVAYTLVVVWALFGIASRQANLQLVVTTAVVLMIALLAGLVADVLLSRRPPHPALG
jgi:translocator protein